MRWMLWLVAGVTALVLVLVANTLRLPPSPAVPARFSPAPIDAATSARRLAGALQVATITVGESGPVDWSPWPRLHEHLVESFPRVHAALQREVVNQYSLLYTWPGRNPGAAPILLLAHQDVVPVEPGTEGAWRHPAFGGVIAEGHVWGRGALDDKASLMGQLEAVEWLLQRGFEPSRTIYLAFGHDEEIGGRDGAAAIARHLERRGVRALFSLDEGGAITQGVVAGISQPVAMVATAEKGYVSFRLTTRDVGGHSSRPPPVTAVGRLAAAVSRIERNPRPLRLGAPVDTMLQYLAPAMPLGRRVVLANLWLFRPLVAAQMARAPLTAALVRTTTAPTLLRAGIKDNVLPTEATAVVNFRLLPGDSIAALRAQLEALIDDPAVALEVLPFSSEPLPVASPATAAFAAIERTTLEVFPEARIAPGLVIGATDNRHYAAVSAARYNFLPVTLTDRDVQRVHGANERVAVEAYQRAIQFYIRLLENVAGPSSGMLD